MAEAYTRTGIVTPPENRRMCFMFSDMRGFTAMSQKIEPEILFDMISDHLGMQAGLVYGHGGYIDKFGGDGLMAVFDGGKSVLQACHCALEIMRQSAALIKPGDGQSMRPGIGIHVGNAFIGNIGSTDHLECSVIGVTVNLAARLCGVAGELSIVVSADVRESVGDLPGLGFTEERQVPVKGFREPITVYTLENS